MIAFLRSLRGAVRWSLVGHTLFGRKPFSPSAYDLGDDDFDDRSES